MGWFDQLWGQNHKSASAAKERLKFVLIHDRTDITPGMLEAIKNEILEVLSRHIEIDPATVNINMTQEGKEQRLIADIPIKPARRKKTGR